MTRTDSWLHHSLPTLIADAYAHVVLKNLASFVIFVENDQNTSILTDVTAGGGGGLRSIHFLLSLRDNRIHAEAGP